MTASLTKDQNIYLKYFKKTIHILLTILTILFVISGLGITNYQIVEPITFGLLSKSLSQKIHLNLTIPFVILLIIHLYLTIGTKYLRRFKKMNNQESLPKSEK